MSAETHVDLTNRNAGYVTSWLRERGIPAVMRGGPKGGSIGGTVILNQRGQKLTIEPGDRVRVIDGEVAVS